MAVTETDLHQYYLSLRLMTFHVCNLVEVAKDEEDEVESAYDFVQRLDWFGGKSKKKDAYSQSGRPRWETLSHRRELMRVAAETELYRIASPVMSCPELCGDADTCWSNVVFRIVAQKFSRTVALAVGEKCGFAGNSIGADWWDDDLDDELREHGMSRIASHFPAVRQAVLERFSTIRPQYGIVDRELRKEHAHVLIGMRRDRAIKPERRGRSSLGVNDMPTPEDVQKIKAIYESGTRLPKLVEDFAKQQGMRKQKLTNINRILCEETPGLVPYGTRTPRRGPRKSH